MTGVQTCALPIYSDRNAATFITRDHAIDIPEMSKREMADRILDQVVALRTAQPSPSRASHHAG